jgi:hypothetical protein
VKAVEEGDPNELPVLSKKMFQVIAFFVDVT